MLPSGFVLFVLFSTTAIIVNADNNGNPLSLTLFRDCMSKFGITNSAIVDRASNASKYDLLNHQWNFRIAPVSPLAYFLPESTLDVQHGIQCSINSSTPVIPKSGGHSYESYCFGTSESIVIDFQRMNRIQMITQEKVANIQPGATVAQIHLTLYYTNNAGLGLSSGIYPSVGIGGLALGGGIGHISNRYGLTMDNILEMTMVDAAGNAHLSNATENPDLFWALRGVGSGFIGIVTEFKFKLFQASNIETTIVNLNFDKTQTMDFMVSWQNWITWMDQNEPNIFCGAGLHEGGIIVYFASHRDTSASPPEPGPENVLAAIQRIFENHSNFKNFTIPYIELVESELKKFSSPANANAENDTLIHPMYFKTKSFFVDQLFPSETDNFKNLTALLRNLPKGIFLQFDRPTGVGRNIAPDATAYVHRNSLYVVAAMYSNDFDVESEHRVGLEYLQKFWETSQFMNNGRTYQNFVDDELKDYGERYYGENLGRLTDIKAKWDPNNRFRNPNSIVPLKNGANSSVKNFSFFFVECLITIISFILFI